MKLKEYLALALAPSDPELYLQIQRYELINHICRNEGLSNETRKDLMKKFITYTPPEKSALEGNILYMDRVWKKLIGEDKWEYFNTEILMNGNEYQKIICCHIRKLYKDYPSIFVDIEPMDMPSKIQFNNTFDKVFGDYSDGSNKWRSKKAKLKKKYMEKTDGTYVDYELILFNYIISLEERKPTVELHS